MKNKSIMAILATILLVSAFVLVSDAKDDSASDQSGGSDKKESGDSGGDFSPQIITTTVTVLPKLVPSATADDKGGQNGKDRGVEATSGATAVSTPIPGAMPDDKGGQVRNKDNESEIEAEVRREFQRLIYENKTEFERRIEREVKIRVENVKIAIFVQKNIAEILNLLNDQKNRTERLDRQFLELNDRVKRIETKLNLTSLPASAKSPAAQIGISTVSVSPSGGGCELKNKEVNWSNIKKKEKRCRDASFNKTVAFKFVTGVIVEEIGFFAKESAQGGEIGAQIELLRGLSTGVKTEVLNNTDNVLLYFNVAVGEPGGYADSDKIQGRYLAVNLSGYANPEELRIMRFSGGEWTDAGELEPVRENIYKVSVSGFGNYALIREQILLEPSELEYLNEELAPVEIIESVSSEESLLPAIAAWLAIIALIAMVAGAIYQIHKEYIITLPAIKIARRMRNR